ncbi:PHD finger protein 7 [Drosophila ficusphila]|uniref:PHD finger protein 7 n=1 Tax=Drosophila ficusphila TaxID=30025 RepID=UPI0007E8AAF8|nr:PHD finger protein 7 [Drosophila ficusphila]
MGNNQELVCDICGFDTSDPLLYGDWMTRNQVRVHYYCLLCSTNLPQRGGDSAGILGFLLVDIRREAAAAKKRRCTYCQKMQASVQCRNCSTIFHLKCGIENRCTFQFIGQFDSFCDKCTPMDDYKRELVANPPKKKPCDICLNPISRFSLFNAVYGDCCRKGFAHKNCMRRYALASGYYLRCIWCRDTKFRETICMQSIFVPDRDATWEQQKGAYRELHERTVSCNLENCLCPNGRNFNRNTWLLLTCKLCASTGAHAKCLAGTFRLSKRDEPNEFKCTLCEEVENKISEIPTQNLDASITGNGSQVDVSFYVHKSGPNMPPPAQTEMPMFSDTEDEDSMSANSSVITVISSQARNKAIRISPQPSNVSAAVESEVIEIPDSPIPNESNDIFKMEPSAPVEIEVSQLNSAPDTDPHTLLMLKESFRTNEPYYYVVIYEFEQGIPNGDCVGTCTLRFNVDDPRIQDTSKEALQRIKLTPDDIWFRDKDRGVYGQIDRFKQRRLDNKEKS